MGDPVTLADFRAVQDKLHEDLKKLFTNVKKLAFAKRTTEAYETFYAKVLKYETTFRANHDKILALKLKPEEFDIYMDKCYNPFIASYDLILEKADNWIEGSNLVSADQVKILIVEGLENQEKMWDRKLSDFFAKLEISREKSKSGPEGGQDRASTSDKETPSVHGEGDDTGDESSDEEREPTIQRLQREFAEAKTRLDKKQKDQKRSSEVPLDPEDSRDSFWIKKQKKRRV